MIDLSKLSPATHARVCAAIQREVDAEAERMRFDLSYWSEANPGEPSPARLEMEAWAQACADVSRQARELRRTKS